ncbi:MAG TPA: hypothetical protein VGL53_02645 [Bryobacteraceae bacterium]|jgi:hypothetical protein
MTADEIRQLLGGYASGTLSEPEKKLLFEAALEDQVLFDAMADEQALKDLLDDPESRGYLQAVLDEARPEAVEEIVSLKAARSVMPPAPVAAAPAPSPVPAPHRRVPPVWWGMLAAAALAVVMVVGIRRFDQRPTTIEVAELKKSAPAPAAQKEAEPPPKPAVAAVSKASPKAPRPARIENPSLDKLKEQAAPREKSTEVARAGGAPAPAPAKDEVAIAGKRPAESNAAPTAPAAAAPPPPPPPAVALATPAGRPEQAQNGISAQPATVVPNASQQVPRDQVQVASEQPQQVAPAQSAREQYLSVDRASADAKSAQLEQSKPATKERKKTTTAGRGATSAGRMVGGASSSAAGAGVANGPSGTVSGTSAKPAFAMRVKLLRRKASGEFAAVAPTTAFRVGEEVVVVIEKNSGGVASITRAGSRDPVPMAIETDAMAQTVPLTVTGPMEFSVTLTRSGAVRRFEAPQQSSVQTTESADDMIYVAEPAGASAQALVTRIAIRVAQ